MIDAALKRFLIEQPEVKNAVGLNVYAGRIPQTRRNDPDIATVIILQYLDGTTFPDLPGEGTCEQAVIQVEGIGRGPGGESRVWKAIRAVQKATTENSFTGYMGFAEQRYWVLGMSTQRIGRRIPTGPFDNSDNWTHRFSKDIRITFQHKDE